MRKRINWLNVLLGFYILFALWKVVGHGRPFLATVLYYYAQDLQRAARFFGEAGLGAEFLYHEAMQRYTLAS